MDLYELIKIFDELAPQELALDFDNVGLIIEPVERDIKKILFAVDCTLDVIDEAKDLGAQLIFTHHPLLFKPVKSLSYQRADTAAVCKLIRCGIGHFAAHTNLDAVQGGVNDALAKELGIKNVTVAENDPIMRLGELESELSLYELASFIKGKLDTEVRFAPKADLRVKRVALIGGSGSRFLAQAKELGAQALITGEVRHNDTLNAGVLNTGLIECGHYESERVIIKPFIAGLHKALEAVQCKVELMESKKAASPFIAL